MFANLEEFGSWGTCGSAQCQYEGENYMCGIDDKTYKNMCYLRLAGVEMKYKGKCMNYECPNDYRPVCGVDGQTYKNDCLLAKAGVNKRAVGRCEMSSTCDHCPLENKPVCGMDGFTYLNVCIMTCLGG